MPGDPGRDAGWDCDFGRRSFAGIGGSGFTDAGSLKRRSMSVDIRMWQAKGLKEALQTSGTVATTG